MKNDRFKRSRAQVSHISFLSHVHSMFCNSTINIYYDICLFKEQGQMPIRRGRKALLYLLYLYYLFD